MALRLPYLATDRLKRAGRAPVDRPVAVYGREKNACVLFAVDRQAAAAGLLPGTPLADARAMQPKLAAFDHEPAADGEMLDHIAAWCERFSPVIALDPPAGLFLDVSGCAHLFGGEKALIDAARNGLRRQGFATSATIAPTPGAAWAAACFRGPAIIEADGLLDALSPLPVAALRLSPPAAALLQRLGLLTIGDIAAAPRTAFAARAGAEAMLRLDQALDRAHEALTPRRPAPPVFALRRLLEPLLDADLVLKAVATVCADLARSLDGLGIGVRLMRLSLFGVDAKAHETIVGLTLAERDPHLIMRLLAERLGGGQEIDPGFGIEAIRLDALETGSFGAVDGCRWLEAAAADEEAKARLVDRLVARLGAHCVGQPALRDAHAPERASVWASLAGQKALPTTPFARPPSDGVMRRPLTLFSPPQPIAAVAALPDSPPVRFSWRRQVRDVARAEGPERIAAGRRGGGVRDYYRVEDGQGRRYWVFREHEPHDVVEDIDEDAGRSGMREGASRMRWFIHGLFA